MTGTTTRPPFTSQSPNPPLPVSTKVEPILEAAGVSADRLRGGYQCLADRGVGRFTGCKTSSKRSGEIQASRTRAPSSKPWPPSSGPLFPHHSEDPIGWQTQKDGIRPIRPFERQAIDGIHVSETEMQPVVVHRNVRAPNDSVSVEVALL